MRNFFESQSNFPKILIVSESPIRWNQGTGVRVLRNLSGYPENRVLNIFSIESEGEDPPFYIEHFKRKQIPSLIRRFVRRISPRITIRLDCLFSKPSWRKRLRELIARHKPDVILGIPFREEGLQLVEMAFKTAPTTAKKIVHLYDWMPRRDSRFCVDKLIRIAELADCRWTLGINLSNAASEWTGFNFSTVPIFYDSIPKDVHKPKPLDGNDARVVMLGNVWCPEALYMIAEAWKILQKKFPNLAPIRWFGSEWTMSFGWKEEMAEGGALYKRIQYAGFVSREELKAELLNSDLAVIPFSVPETDSSDYARFSIPSRVTELSLIGLPQLAVTSETTGLGKFYTDSGFGLIENSSSNELASKIENIILSLSERKRQSEAAITFSKSNFDLNQFQRFFYEQIGGQL